MLGFLAGLMDRISQAIRDPQQLPAVLMLVGVVVSAPALSLAIFKAPGGIFLMIHGRARDNTYYSILITVVIFRLAEASLGFWVVPRDLLGWRFTGKVMLWASLMALVVVAALGGLAFLH